MGLLLAIEQDLLELLADDGFGRPLVVDGRSTTGVFAPERDTASADFAGANVMRWRLAVPALAPAPVVGQELEIDGERWLVTQLWSTEPILDAVLTRYVS